jgi:signal transduction histidine kinase
MVAQFDDAPADSGLPGWVIEHGEPLVVQDVPHDPRAPQAAVESGLTSFIGVPIRGGGDILAVLSLFGETEQQPRVEEVALLGSIADQIGVTIENARLRRLAEQAAVLAERERLAQDLHDSVTQSLYSLTLFTKAASELARRGELERLRDRLSDIGESAQQALKEMRLLVHQLRPSVLRQEGLAGALQRRLEAVEKRSGLRAELWVEGRPELPEGVEVGLYHIALEALNNGLKHALASAIVVHLRILEEKVELEVVDDGKGFDPNTASEEGGMGLTNMQKRAEKMGGLLAVLSSPGAGTRITASVDLCRRAAGNARGRQSVREV